MRLFTLSPRAVLLRAVIAAGSLVAFDGEAQASSATLSYAAARFASAFSYFFG